MQDIVEVLKSAVKDLFNTDIEPELTRPDEQFGDFATNVAMQLGGRLHKNPREIAVALAGKLHGQEGITEVNIAGPGFINLKLTDNALLKNLDSEPVKIYEGKTIVAEYSDPNPFKILHAGHLYTSVVGDAIANLLENAGADVHRVNFGGDVGLHVAKTMWAIIKELGGEDPKKLAQIDLPDAELRAGWLSKRYIEGNNAYEDNLEAKQEITDINHRVYDLHHAKKTMTEDEYKNYDSDFSEIYWTTRQWSYDYFDFFYDQIGSHFDKYYPESETAPLGLEVVKQHVPKVYQDSDGAIVFKGEPYGLHTRVFINSKGLPTYEAKDVGLIMKKWEDYHFDHSIVITGNDIVEYMKVVLKSIEQFAPELAAATMHLTHGIVKLAGGEKMSSRKGNILGALDIIADTGVLVQARGNLQTKKIIVYGAIKYAFLKQRMGGDIIYDPKESVNLEGNSGPYLQYAHARARNILAKAGDAKPAPQDDLDENERSLARKLSEYPEAVEKATKELMPHQVATYLYELSQVFNRFYEKSRVIDDPREDLRLQLVNKYAEVLKSGLSLLGISAPDKM